MLQPSQRLDLMICSYDQRLEQAANHFHHPARTHHIHHIDCWDHGIPNSYSAPADPFADCAQPYQIQLRLHQLAHLDVGVRHLLEID